jgi:hypothetical protein
MNHQRRGRMNNQPTGQHRQSVVRIAQQRARTSHHRIGPRIVQQIGPPRVRTNSQLLDQPLRSVLRIAQ